MATDSDDGMGSPGPAAARRELERKWLVLAVVIPIAVMVDQITKQIAEATLATRGMVIVVDGFFMFDYSRNPGAFFSLGADMEPTLRRVFFVGATLAAVALVVHLYRRASESQRALRWALLMLLAGAVGNLVDRVLYGEVIDFIRLHYRDVFYWATFNVADVYICIGLGLLLVDVVRPARPSEVEPRATH